MKLYIAAPWVRQSETRDRAEQLKSLGIEVTSRWLTEDPEAEQTPTYQQERALIDLEDIRAADYFVLLAEHDSRTGGKHFETGYAYAIGKRVLVVGRHENVFHHLPEIVYVSSWDNAMTKLHFVQEALLDATAS